MFFVGGDAIDDRLERRRIRVQRLEERPHEERDEADLSRGGGTVQSVPCADYTSGAQDTNTDGGGWVRRSLPMPSFRCPSPISPPAPWLDHIHVE